MEIINIFWFRRDLRLYDNAGLWHSLQSGRKVLPVFIFDKNILEDLQDKNDRRVHFIHQQLKKINNDLREINSTLQVLNGTPDDAFKDLIKQFKIEKVFTNNDYEPYAIRRDEQIKKILKDSGIEFLSFKDQVIFEKKEVVKSDGSPYTVFTPYSKQWKVKIALQPVETFSTQGLFNNFFEQPFIPVPELNQIGFRTTEFTISTHIIGETFFRDYEHSRNFPSEAGTSRLSVQLRFGPISIRELYKKSILSHAFLNELIWRDFYFSVLWNFPRVGEHKAFKEQYDHIEWRNNEQEFTLWCKGQTGYPIVDAGMRELNSTGFMHNRLRMITASFLCKHLLIDWRWGEAYFAEKLLDYDLAANNGGWQWAAGTGCDAAPYFRIFNPYLQTKKFDPEFKYIRRWVPEFESLDYPKPIVQHEFARARCLESYRKALSNKF
ncbi:deoxyribodipyrimidine photo-lyase [soil metagenome]